MRVRASLVVRRLEASRPGVALPAAVFGLVVVGVLSAGIFVLTDLDNQATKNRQDSSTAEQLAHTAAAHALSLLRGQLRDTSYTRLLMGFNTLSTSDDGLLTGFPGLGDTLNIPSTGRAGEGGTYFARIVNDPAEALPLVDVNRRVILRCTGVSDNGSRAVIDMIISNATAALPAIVVDGPLLISGNPTLLGACGDIHTNGQLYIGGTTRVNSYASTSASGSTGNQVRDASGQSEPVLRSQPTLSIPSDMTYSNYCPQNADYILRGNGWVVRTSMGDSLNATSTARYGWKRSSSSPVIWASDSDNMTSGTFCIYGNAQLSHNPGTPLNPLRMSIIATGSVEVSGNPYLKAEDESNVVVFAGGDLKINGNPASFTSASYEGIVYGGSQCEISGNPVIWAQILCDNNAAPGGHGNIVDENKISGDARITYNCGNSGSDATRKVAAWYPRVGM